MNHLQSLIQKINKRTSVQPIYYITSDPERALGFEQLIDNYKVVTQNSYLAQFYKNAGLDLFIIDSPNNLKSTGLIRNNIVNDYIKSNSDQCFIQTFKNSERFEEFAKEFNAVLLNDKYENNLRFERKIDQFNNLRDLNINFPYTQIITLGEYSYKDLMKHFGEKFVLQFNIGHTGSSTYFIENSGLFDTLKLKFPNRQARISKFLSGPTYTVNGCIYNKNYYYSGLSLQITGVEPYAHTNAATIGNDWAFAKETLLNEKENVLSELSRIGQALIKYNYRGLFGVDLIIDHGIVYIIEINARQAASIPMNTKLQLEASEVPLSLLHIAEFMGINEDINNTQYNVNNLFSIDASQVFIRYGENMKNITQVESGTYSLSNDMLTKINSRYDLNTLKANEFVILSNTKKSFKEGDEIIRFQIKEQVMANYYDFRLSAKKILETLVRI